MKRLVMIVGLLLVVCLLVPVSCAKASTSEEAPSMPAIPEGPVPAPSVEMSPPREEAVYKETGVEGLSSTAGERMIVRTGDISLVVEDVVNARDMPMPEEPTVSEAEALAAVDDQEFKLRKPRPKQIGRQVT